MFCFESFHFAFFCKKSFNSVLFIFRHILKKMANFPTELKKYQDEIKKRVAEYPDFPIKGVLFRFFDDSI